MRKSHSDIAVESDSSTAGRGVEMVMRKLESKPQCSFTILICFWPALLRSTLLHPTPSRILIHRSRKRPIALPPGAVNQLDEEASAGTLSHIHLVDLIGTVRHCTALDIVLCPHPPLLLASNPTSWTFCAALPWRRISSSSIE